MPNNEQFMNSCAEGKLRLLAKEFIFIRFKTPLTTAQEGLVCAELVTNKRFKIFRATRNAKFGYCTAWFHTGGKPQAIAYNPGPVEIARLADMIFVIRQNQIYGHVENWQPEMNFSLERARADIAAETEIVALIVKAIAAAEQID